MKNRLLIIFLISFPLYGIVMSISFQIHSEYVYESGMYIFNPIVELAIIKSTISYLFDNFEFFPNFEEFIMLRIFFNLVFWIPFSFVTFGFYKLGRLIHAESIKHHKLDL